MRCDYCHKDPGLKPESEVVWNGFLDKETGHHVCFKCRQRHYALKFRRAKWNGSYMEFPVIVLNQQMKMFA